MLSLSLADFTEGNIPAASSKAMAYAGWPGTPTVNRVILVATSFTYMSLDTYIALLQVCLKNIHLRVSIIHLRHQ